MLQLIKDIALWLRGLYASRVALESTGSGINYISNLLTQRLPYSWHVSGVRQKSLERAGVTLSLALLL